MIKIGIIGAGRIARVHTRAVAAHPNATLVVVSDPVEEAGTALAQEYGALERTPAAPPAPSSRVIRGDGGKQTTRDKFASYFD